MRLAVRRTLAVGALLLAASAPSTPAAAEPPSLMTAGWEHTCAQLQGRLACLGGNLSGQRGDGTYGQIAAEPMPVAELGAVTDASAGTEHTCAVTTDGGAWCWGSGAWGELGDGTTQSRPTPVRVRGEDGAPLVGVTDVEVGRDHSCATVGGRVWCQGQNLRGQLGRGRPDGLMDTGSPNPVPAPVEGLDDVVELDGRNEHNCARRADDSVWCWGRNDFGQLGHVSDEQCISGLTLVACSTTPRRVAGLQDVVGIAVGWFHSCALQRDGTVSCWGSNHQGQLGVPPTTRSATEPLVALRGARSVHAGGHHGCAVDRNGRLLCWGHNHRGQVGNGLAQTDNAYVRGAPVLPALIEPEVIDVALGVHHSCARRSDGWIWCWGWNHSQQLGYRTDPLDSSTVPKATPMRTP